MMVSTEITCDSLENDNKTHQPSDFRVFLSQLIPILAKNIVILDLTMSLGYGSIVIAALLNAKSDLRFTDEQASWFGSLPFFMVPIGSLISGIFFEPFGRKKIMLIVNIPVFMFWAICWRASTVWELKIASVICGIAAGFTTPSIIYTGEVCQSKWRGVLTSLTGLVMACGYTLIYSIGAIIDWQTTALIAMITPVAAFVTILLIPESPVWLLSQGRSEEAAKALSWLRGWTTPDMVKEELQDLAAYSSRENSNSESNTAHLGIQKWIKKFEIDALWDRKTLFPFIIMIISFIFLQASGVFATRPYVVVIMEEFQSPIDFHQSAVMSSAVTVLGNITCTVLVRRIGKRSFLIGSQVICTALTLSIAIYEFSPLAREKFGWIPVTLFTLLCFTWGTGIGPIPMMLLADLFPIRGRVLCSGLGMAFFYLNGFFIIKTYYNIHDSYGLKGLFAIYAVISSIGSIVMYIIVPETEGHSLEVIEKKLQDNASAGFVKNPIVRVVSGGPRPCKFPQETPDDF